jgi:hypothetical protein
MFNSCVPLIGAISQYIFPFRTERRETLKRHQSIVCMLQKVLEPQYVLQYVLAMPIAQNVAVKVAMLRSVRRRC